MTVLRLRGVTREYPMGDVVVRALRGVDLSLERGELVVLLGPSGSGKSTLLHMLGALDAPTTGQVLWHRDAGAPLDLARADDGTRTRFRRAHVGFVFQFYNLLASLTARENIAVVTEIATDPLDPLDALRLVDLADRADHFPSQLSGGEQQRVAIARAIAKRPALLLCDEPTGALDVKTGKVVLRALRRIHLELGTATVLITHNAAIAAMADRVLRIADGQIVGDTRNAAPADPDTVDW
ncbi:MAG: ABC transporter ATP-binding protein [Planctomycetes bacterium]|nr:ABC transporter ATP-binding protein [Planctomycetota bacterium]